MKFAIININTKQAFRIEETAPSHLPDEHREAVEITNAEAATVNANERGHFAVVDGDLVVYAEKRKADRLAKRAEYLASLPAVVPDEVTAAQLLSVLTDTQVGQVEGFLAALPDGQLKRTATAYWTRNATFRRADPLLNQMAAGLDAQLGNWSQSDLDAIFLAAGNIATTNAQ